MARRSTRWLGVGSWAALGLTLAAASACRVSTADHPLVRAYLDAEPVTPTWSTEGTPALTWRTDVELGGASVALSAACGVGGRFVARYSDERDLRLVFTPGDYLCPAELRVGRRERVVYGRASGTPAVGSRNVTKVFAFDLNQRRLLASAEVDPAILPPAVEPASPRPRP